VPTVTKTVAPPATRIIINNPAPVQTQVQVPAPAAPQIPSGTYGPYLEAIAAAGIVAPDTWTVNTGTGLCDSWANGATVADTDPTLLAGGIYPEHLATFDAITQAYLCPGTYNGT
jgi:hypothetical protein